MQFEHETNLIYARNESGTVVASITFPMVDEGLVCIDHTFVDASLRGQGVAGKLMEEVSKQLKANGIKACASCSYATHWIETHPELSDLFVKI